MSTEDLKKSREVQPLEGGESSPTSENSLRFIELTGELIGTMSKEELKEFRKRPDVIQTLEGLREFIKEHPTTKE